MKDKKFKHLSKKELIEIIYQLEQQGENTNRSEDLPDIKVLSDEISRRKRRSRFKKAILSTTSILIVVASIAALISTLFLPVLQVSGTSMEPTLKDKDVIVLVKTDHLKTGDLVGLYYNGKILLKRIIGTTGDFISIDSDGNVFVNGNYIDEPYIDTKSLGECDIKFPYQVPESSYFILGDHRSTSIDSRNSTIGCIKKDRIIGKAVLRLFPIDSIDIL